MRLVIIISGVLTGLIVILGAFPWGILRGVAEDRLTEQIGQPVAIESLRREEVWSLTPSVIARGVRARQAAWAGEGNLADIDAMTVRFDALALLLGRMRVRGVKIDGMTLALARDSNGRENWSREDPNKDSSKAPKKSGGGPGLRKLLIRNMTVSYDDAAKDRRITADVTADAQSGLLIEGAGFIHDAPVRLVARGAPVAAGAAGKPWPFRAEIIGDAVGMVFDGEMEAPLSFGRFTAKATAHGDDLALIDAVIEAGLPETQPVTLAADIERAAPKWIIRDLKGTIGRSDIAGHATINKGARTIIHGSLTSQRLDFDDLSSDEGLRIAAEKRARYGKRIFPDTAIELDNVDDTDGRLEVSVKELLSKGPSPFRSMKGVITVDHQLLTIRPLAIGLTHGGMQGDVVIDQRGGGDPKLDFILETDDARFMDFFPGSGIDGALRGHIKLAGAGKTARAAIARSSGSVAIVAEDGVLPANTASLLGQDVGRGLTVDDDKRAALRCLVLRVDVENGSGVAAPLVIDTSRARTQAQGGINFANEALHLSLLGVPKIDSVVRLDGAIPVTGTIKAPTIGKPEKGDSVGEILGSVGEAIFGDEDPIAKDADCAALLEKALR